jgi:hypothetical protein
MSKKKKVGRPRKHPLDVRVPANFSISRQVLFEFKRICAENEVSHNEVLEVLLKDFNNH